MSFAFGFSGDDIEDGGDARASRPRAASLVDEFMSEDMAIAGPYRPRASTAGELLRQSAPLRVSYGLVHTAGGGPVLPRRDLYDVKYQLMSQNKLSETDEILLGTTNEDLRAATYEGGLKTWECSFDLLSAISSEADVDSLGHAVNGAGAGSVGSKAATSVIELGCGAALPALYLFHRLLTSDARNGRLVLADYNESVLRLLTAPNMLLTWWTAVNGPSGGELDVTPELIQQFEDDLARRHMELTFVSGAWSPQFVRLVGQGTFDLVLASETIYSLETLPVFTDTMLNCLAQGGQALVAAKKIYFGVGGGVPDFMEALRKRSAQYESVSDHVDGVGRAVLKVHRPKASVDISN